MRSNSLGRQSLLFIMQLKMISPLWLSLRSVHTLSPTSRKPCRITWCEACVSCKVHATGALPILCVVKNPRLEQSLALWSLNKHMLNELMDKQLALFNFIYSFMLLFLYLLVFWFFCVCVCNFEIHLNSKGQGRELLGFQVTINNTPLFILSFEPLRVRYRRKSGWDVTVK